VCESSDYLAKDRYLPPMSRGDLLAVFSAGAYGMAMASNYNGRPRAAEVLVDGSEHHLIRRRETYEDLIELRLNADVEVIEPWSPACSVGVRFALRVPRRPSSRRAQDDEKAKQAEINKRKTFELLEKPRRNTASSSSGRKPPSSFGRRSSSKWTWVSSTSRGCTSS